MCTSCSWHGLKSKSISLCSCKLIHAKLKCANILRLVDYIFFNLSIMEFIYTGFTKWPMVTLIIELGVKETWLFLLLLLLLQKVCLWVG
jgi:hypothetical protein